MKGNRIAKAAMATRVINPGVIVSLRMDGDLADAVLAKAEADGKRVSQTLRELIKAGLGQAVTSAEYLANLERRIAALEAAQPSQSVPQ